jgi:N4-gp56 family major capsid protein
MAVTIRTTTWGGSSSTTSELLTAYIAEEIKTLEPQLQYARLGVKRDIPKGSDRLVFPQFNQIPVKINTSMQTTGGPAGFSGYGSVWGAGTSVQGGATATAPGFPVSSTEGVAAMNEGSNPSAITWGATSYNSGPAQYGILVQVSDLLIHGSALDVVEGCTRKVTESLARQVDLLIGAVVNAGTNGVIYAGGKSTRAGLGAGDTLTQSDMQRAYKYLASSNAAGLKPYEGKYYVAVIHPQVEGDLMNNSQTGAFQDVGRYTSVDDLRAGALGDFRGIRYLRSAFQAFFNSTVPVFPTTVLGDQSFGWGFFQQPTPILTTTPDSNNPLMLYSSIGGKVTLGVTRFEDTSTGTVRIIRLESAISN